MYFFTGNLWLMVALVLMLGETVIPATGGLVRFFEVGPMLVPSVYRKFIWFALGAAAVSFVLAFRSRNKNAEAK